MATAATKNDPSNTSSAYNWMKPKIDRIAAIMGGVDTIIAGEETYLPKFEAEDRKTYRKRLKYATLTNVFADIIDSLGRKPFTERVRLKEGATSQLEEITEDVSGCGESLHAFLSNIFRASIEDGLTWVVVDYTDGIPGDATVAQERAMGARPRWVHYRQANVLAAYSEVVNGEERFTEIRLHEVTVEQDGFDEVETERVRIFRQATDMAQPTWELWKRNPQAVSKEYGDWEMEIEPTPLDIDIIPVVPVIFGERIGKTWMVEPPLINAANLQIELYQKENGLKNTRIATAFPMLSGNNVEPEVGADGEAKPLQVGPNAVLFGGRGDQGQGGSWEFIEPSAASLNFLREDIKDTIKELRELGRQPLTAQSGNLTVITTAFAAEKANSLIEAWVYMLENYTSGMFGLTAKWLNLGEWEAQVDIHKDFDLGFGDDASFAYVIQLATGEAPLISREAALEEGKRRGILGPNYDIEEDLEKVGVMEGDE